MRFDVIKKICFVTMGNIYIVPYLSTYTNHIKGNYSVIYWDREGKNEAEGNNKYYRFYKELSPKDKLEKITGFIQYKKFVKRILLKEKFDIVIFLQTWSALLMADVVEKHYPGKYIVDVRDYTYEKIPFIYNREKKLMKNAAMCVVSSEGYKDFLPPHDYYVFHNTRDLPVEKVAAIRERNKVKNVLHISFIGYVNYQEQHKKLLMNLKNDPRFHLNFIGTRSLELEPFCKENDIRNVTLMDTFDASKILDFYENTDFVNNLYGNHTPVLDYALSNKLYFAAELRMPILTCADTYMSKISGKYGFGFEVDVADPQIGDKLWKFYTSIDWENFDSCCDDFIEKVQNKNCESIEFLKKVLSV